MITTGTDASKNALDFLQNVSPDDDGNDGNGIVAGEVEAIEARRRKAMELQRKSPKHATRTTRERRESDNDDDDDDEGDNDLTTFLEGASTTAELMGSFNQQASIGVGGAGGTDGSADATVKQLMLDMFGDRYVSLLSSPHYSLITIPVTMIIILTQPPLSTLTLSIYSSPTLQLRGYGGGWGLRPPLSARLSPQQPAGYYHCYCYRAGDRPTRHRCPSRCLPEPRTHGRGGQARPQGRDPRDEISPP